MEFEFRMANVMGLLRNQNDPKPEDTRKARIFEDEAPVCTLRDRKNCYDPDSLKKAFHPLGIFSKMFGLFPCYDFTFSDNSTSTGQTSRRLRFMHLLDYLYSAFIFILLTGGAIIVHIYKPRILESKCNDSGDMDYYVKLGLIYAKIIAGIPSLFIFPMKWNGVLNFVKLMSNIDKILMFDGRKEERCFALKLLFYMICTLIFTLGSFFVLFVLDGKSQPSCIMDYILTLIVTLALMGLVIPTGLAIFFLNAIRLRMEHFNRKMHNILQCFIPSCATCMGFSDYGKELDTALVEKKQLDILPENLEKMRILHCEIRTLGNCMSCIFGMHLVRDFLYSMVAMVLYTYFLLYFQEDGLGITLIYAGQCAFLVLKILMLVCFTQLICYQVTISCL